MKTNYTPAPWKVSHDLYGINGGKLIAHECAPGSERQDPVGIAFVTPNYEGTEDHKTMIANARLIAAAPDLLETLMKISRIDLPDDDQVPLWNEIQAVIRKAVGE